MALVLADRVRDTTTTVGTADLVLSGTAPVGFQNFSVVGNGNTTYYTVTGGSQWEVGIGTYSATGPTLARTTVLSSSAGGTKVSFAAGTKSVFVTLPAERTVDTDTLGAATGSSLVGYTQGGSGAVTRTAQAKMRDTVSALDFGVVGDGVADDTVALQAALNYAVANQRTVLLPSGRYKITNSLFIGTWNGTSWAAGFASAGLSGETYAYATALSAVIAPTFNDKPALILQNVRGVTVENIAFIGQNTILSAIQANYTLMMTESNFVVGGARDSRYSPYAAICIDPFGTSVPPDGGYPGLTAYYTSGAAGSSKININNVTISDFVVGIMVTPNNVTLNAEDIFIQACPIFGTKVGIAIGQSQSRAVSVLGGNTAFCYYGFDTRSYGRQQGSLPHIDGTNMSGKYLFNVGPNYLTPPSIQNIHAESFASIGSFYSPATSQQPITFLSCTFNFSGLGPGAGGTSILYADSVYSSTAPTKFIGCSFENALYDGVFRMYTTAPIDFDTCSFRTKQNELPLWRSAGAYSLQFNDMTFRNCQVIFDTTRGSTMSILTDDMVAYYFTTVNRRYAPYGGRVRLYDTATNAQRVYWNANLPASQNETSISTTQAITVGTDGTATMTVPDGTLVRVGDAVISVTAFTPEGTALSSTYNPIGIVTSVVGNNVTFSGVPQNLPSGTYSIRTAWWARYHLASTGDLTLGSTDILNVANPTTWVAGNKIKGTGIAVGAYVTAVVGTTVSISKAATATNTGVRLFDADLYYAAGTAY